MAHAPYWLRPSWCPFPEPRKVKFLPLTVAWVPEGTSGEPLSPASSTGRMVPEPEMEYSFSPDVWETVPLPLMTK